MYFHTNFANLARANSFFGKEIFTGSSAQIVTMSLNPNEDIGEETHNSVDQIFFFIEGRGKAIVSGTEIPVNENDILFIQRSTNHNIINTSSEKMKIISVYAPAKHPRGLTQATKADALKAEN